MRLGEFRSNRKAIVLVLCSLVALAAAGVALGFTLVGSPTLITLPTTGAYAPLTWPHPLLVAADFIADPIAPIRIDPDTMVRSGADVQTVLTRISSNRYELQIVNTSGIGFIDSFHWYPPGGMTLGKVTSSSSGSCQVGGSSVPGNNLFSGAVLNPEIDCTGISLKPPTCTCLGNGGHLNIVFTVTQGSYTAGLMSGSVRITTGTPVLNLIPGFQTPLDAPVCKANQTNTQAHPCSPSGNG